MRVSFGIKNRKTLRLEALMKRMLGFILFWIAIGMTIMLFITNGILAIIIILLCLILGYNLFCC